MSDFKSWDEVKDWLVDSEENWNTVSYHAWTWSKSYMSCYDEDCGCSDDYETVDDAVESIKDYCGDKLELVNKND